MDRRRDDKSVSDECNNKTKKVHGLRDITSAERERPD